MNAALRPHLAAASALLAASLARADPPTVFLALDESSASFASLRDGFRQAAGGSGWRALDPAEARALSGAPPGPCDAACLEALAVSVRADLLVACEARDDGAGVLQACVVRAPWTRRALAGYAAPGTADLPEGLWNAFAAAPPAYVPQRWLSVRTGLGDAQVFVDGAWACAGDCALLVPEGRHAVSVEAPGLEREEHAVDVLEDRRLDVDLGARTGVLRIGSTRAAAVRMGARTFHLGGRGASITVRLREGDHLVSVEDPCHHPESWPVTVPGGGGARVRVDPSPRLGRARLVATSSSGSAVDATAIVDGQERLALPFDGELPLCARVRITAPFHDDEHLRRTGEAAATWAPDIVLDEDREEERGRLAAQPHGFTLRAGVAGLSLTELSLLDFADGDFLFPALGLTARSLAREGGGREAGVGASAEIWAGAHFFAAFLRSQLLWLPAGGVPGLEGNAREAGALPAALTMGGGFGLFVRASPFVLSLAAAYDVAPGRLEGGPSVLGAVTW